jgi:hypothetical protein
MRRAAVPLLALLLLGGCEASSSPPAPTATAEPALVTGELLQFRRDAEARIVQVRLTAAREGLVLESAEVDVDGFRPPPSYQGTTELRGGRALDLRVTLTTPDCSTEPTDVAARVVLAGRAHPVHVPLDDGGLLRRLHAGECADEALLDQVAIEVVSMTETELPEGPALRATVRLTRRSGTDPVRIDDVGDNTVYVIDPEGDLPTLGADGSVDLVLDLLPSRCDVHALGESYRTGLIDLRVSVGDAAPRTFVYEAAEPVRRRIERFAVDTCRGSGG